MTHRTPTRAVTPPRDDGVATIRLARKLGTSDAVFMGLGSMIGAGIFAVLGPAARAAGSALLLGLLVAGFVAYANASSSAALAARYPESGGTYVYARQRLNAFWGFLAGWGFVIGKLASCAAMALTFAFYAAPSHAQPVAFTAVAMLTAINYYGVSKTALATRAIVVVVLACLAAVALAAAFGGHADVSRAIPNRSASAYGILQAAGFLFFAFAGYARIATLGEEVVDPTRTIPRAIRIALLLALVIYATVSVCALVAVGAPALADADAPLVLAVDGGRWQRVVPIVRIGASVASLGVLLSLLAGVSRTVFAMARNGDLPRLLASVHPRHRIPARAEWLVGAAVAAIVLVGDVRNAIGFSSFAVLAYYAIANASALTLGSAIRRRSRTLAGAGIAGCALLAFSLPVPSILGGAAVLGLGAAVYAARRRRLKESP